MGLRGQGGRRSAAGATEVVEERSNPRGERARRMTSEEGLARLACAAGVAVGEERPQAEDLDLFPERATRIDAGMTLEDGVAVIASNGDVMTPLLKGTSQDAAT